MVSTGEGSAAMVSTGKEGVTMAMMGAFVVVLFLWSPCSRGQYR